MLCQSCMDTSHAALNRLELQGCVCVCACVCARVCVCVCCVREFERCRVYVCDGE